MQQDIQKLIEEANSIIKKTGHGPGVRYPQELKDIVIALSIDHGLSVGKIIKAIPISQHSAREWPKQSKRGFRKISIIKEKKLSHQKNNKKKYLIELQLLLLSLQILLLAFQLFLD